MEGAGVATQARSSRPISIGSPAWPRLQLARQGASQMRPRMPGKGIFLRSTFQASAPAARGDLRRERARVDVDRAGRRALRGLFLDAPVLQRPQFLLIHRMLTTRAGEPEARFAAVGVQTPATIWAPANHFFTRFRPARTFSGSAGR